VKRLLESRDERNLVNRKHAKHYFSSKFQIRENNNIHHNHHNICMSESNSFAKYNYINTGRLFRPMKSSSAEYNDPLRVYFTLIEYGMNKDLSFQKTLIDLLKKRNLIEDGKKSSTSTSTVTNKEEIVGGKDNLSTNTNISSTNITNEEKKKLEEIISTNIVANENKNSNRINTSVIEEIFSENIESILQEIDKYENLKSDENVDKIKLFLKEKERLDNNIASFNVQINEYDNELELISNRVENNKLEFEQAEEEIKKLTLTLEENVKYYII
jgi:hypothetical protein